MMYAGSRTLHGLGFVVMDEVHYLADRFRGAVWEEVIIHLPAGRAGGVAVGDGEQRRGVRRLAGRGARRRRRHRLRAPAGAAVAAHDGRRRRCTTCSSTRPPTPVTGIGRDVGVNPELLQAIRGPSSAAAGTTGAGHGVAVATGTAAGGRGRGPRGPGRRSRRPRDGPLGRRSAAAAVPVGERPAPRSSQRLEREGAAAGDHLHLQPGRLRGRGRPAAARRRPADPRRGGRPDPAHRRGAGVRRSPTRTSAVLGYWDFVDGLTRGFAAHHAGMLPTFREIVEELFTAGPDPGGLRHRDAGPGHQHAGAHRRAREAGQVQRRDPRRHHARRVHPADRPGRPSRHRHRGARRSCSGTAAWTRWPWPGSPRPAPTRCAPRSGPTYNMAVNLVAQVGRETAREILETSFAQFQADRAVVGMARAVRKNEEGLEGYAEAMACHLGDFARVCRAAPRDRPAREGRGQGAVGQRARRGRGVAGDAADRRRHPDPGGSARGLRRRGPARRGRTAARRPRPTVVTEDQQLRRLTLVDVPTPVEAIATVKVPPHFNAKSPKARRDLATSLRIAVPHDPPPSRARGDAAYAGSAEDDRIAELRRQLKAHPCHQCPDREDHARWAERWWRLKRETVGLQRKVEGRTNSVARTFDRICTLLERDGLPRSDGGDHGHAAGGAPAPALHREGPARGRVPAPRGVEAARRRRAGRRRVGADPRAAPRRDRPVARGCPTRTSPRRCARWTGCGRARGPRARAAGCR